MENYNHGVLCDVRKCRHNHSGKNCTLSTVKVTCDCEDCTCCDSFECNLED